MSVSLIFRCALLASALATACSENSTQPAVSSPEGNSGGPAQAGGSPARPPSTGGAGGGVAVRSDTGGDAGNSAAGIAESGAGGLGSSQWTAGSGGIAPGSSTPTAVTWKLVAEPSDSGASINVPCAASGGSDAAVAYVERTARRVAMQRFDASGDRIGSLLVLANDADERSNVTLASDGKQYAACWNVSPEIHCSLVDEQGAVHSNALVVPGQYATIVAGNNGWAIAYSGADKQVRLQRLTPALALNASVVGPVIFAQFSVQDVGPLFAATPSGYALVASKNEAGEVDLLRLSPDLQTVVSVAGLGHRLWYAGQLVATDTRAAVSLSIAYGSYLMLLSDRSLTAELPIAGGGKTGTDQALLATKGGLGAAWLDGEGAVRTRFFADDRDAEVGLDPRTPENAVLGLQEEGDESYQQLVHVGDQPLLVARAQRYGSSAIRVAPLKLGQ